MICVERGQRLVRGEFYPTIPPSFIDVKQQKQNNKNGFGNGFANFNEEEDEGFIDKPDSPRPPISSTKNTI